MIETTTNPDLHAIARAAHRQWSLAAWRAINGIRAVAARLIQGRHGKRAAPKNGPIRSVACTA